MKIFIKIIFFYFNDYPQDSNFFDRVNKKFIGKMKHELKREIISEFVGLKPKMYSLVDVDCEESKKAKGVNKCLANGIRQKIVNVLFGGKLIRHRMKRIQSKFHRLGTCDVCKISFSCFDDKTYI